MECLFCSTSTSLPSGLWLLVLRDGRVLGGRGPEARSSTLQGRPSPPPLPTPQSASPLWIPARNPLFPWPENRPFVKVWPNMRGGSSVKDPLQITYSDPLNTLILMLHFSLWRTSATQWP